MILKTSLKRSKSSGWKETFRNIAWLHPLARPNTSNIGSEKSNPLRPSILLILDPSETKNADLLKTKLKFLSIGEAIKIHLLGQNFVSSLPKGVYLHVLPYHRIACSKALSMVLYLVSAFIGAVKVVREYKVDVIANRSGHLYLGAVALLVARLTHRKCLLRVNENSLLEFRLFMQRDLLSNSFILNIAERLLGAVERWVLRNADYVVASGPLIYRKVKEITEKATLVMPVVDRSFDRLPPYELEHIKKELSLKENQKVVLYVGRLDPIKGVSYLLHAFKLVLQGCRDALLLVIGTGKYEGEYRKLAHRLGVGRHVKFLGYRQHSYLPYYYNVADVYVLPSLDENWSNTLMEAICCEVPVVATDVGGNSILIKDGQTGFLVPPRNVEVLADRILYVLDNPKMAKKLALQAKCILKSYYDDVAKLKSYEEVIYDLVGSCGNCREEAL